MMFSFMMVKKAIVQPLKEREKENVGAKHNDNGNNTKRN